MPDTDLHVTGLSRAKRLHERANYQRADAYALLDANVLCHIGYLVEGHPVVTPTAYWRDGDYVYWHGSSASRMLRVQSEEVSVSFTVTHLDAFVVARSAFHHSMNYRSLMLFGKAQWVEEEAAKQAALRTFVERLFPDRWNSLRPMSASEFKATRVLRLRIEEGCLKQRSGPPIDDPADQGLPVWAGVIPVIQHLGTPQPDAYTPADMPVPKLDF